MWKCAKRYNAMAAAQDWKDFYLQHFDATSGEFLECDVDQVREILTDPKLRVASEGDVFAAIVEWAVFRATERWQHVNVLFRQCIRTEHLDRQAVFRKIEHFNSCEADKVMLFDMLYDMERNNLKPDAILAPRTGTDSIESLTVCASTSTKLAIIRYIGGFSSAGNSSVAYPCKLVTTPEPQTEVLYISGDHVVVCGDSNDFVYCFKSREWREVKAKQAHMICAAEILQLPIHGT